MEKADERKSENNDDNHHKDGNNKGKDKKDKKEQNNANKETPQDDVSVLSEGPSDNKSIPPNDDKPITLSPPPALCDSDDKDLKETFPKGQDNPKSYETPSPRRWFSKRLHKQVTPENGEEHKQNSSKY